MNIAVTGLNATDNPGPGVPVLRSLQEDSVKHFLIGLIYDAMEPGLYMENLASKCYQIPYPSGGLDVLLDRIKQIDSKNKIDVLIPTLDSEIFGFVKLENKLKSLGIKTFLPTYEQLNLRAKDKLFDFCVEHGIKVPKNLLITSHKDLYQLSNEFSYPVIVKGIFYEAYKANNFEEVTSAFYKLTAKWGYPIIIQEYVIGDEFNVAALGDGNGNTVGAVSMRKLYITDKGKGWSGITVDDTKLMEISKLVIEKLKWRSGLELEFIKAKGTNDYYMLEINPRFPAWIYLATASGQNLPLALVKLAQNQKVEKFTKFQVGKIFVRYSWDLITDIEKFEKIAVLGEI